MVGFNQRYLERIRKLKALLESHTIGKVRRVRAHHNQSIKEVLVASDWLNDSKKSGGGVVHNAAIHLINVMQYLFGPIEAIQAEFKNLATPVAFGEDTAHLEFDFSSGVSGVLDASFVGAVDSTYEHIVIEGDNGQIQSDMMKGNIITHIRESSGRQKSLIKCRESIPDSVGNEFAHFVDCVRHRRTPDTDINDFIETLRVTEAARLAAKEQRKVQIAEINS